MLLADVSKYTEHVSIQPRIVKSEWFHSQIDPSIEMQAAKDITPCAHKLLRHTERIQNE